MPKNPYIELQDLDLTSSFVPVASAGQPEPTLNGRTVTVFLCGTCSKQEDKKASDTYYNGEIISRTYEETLGKELVHKIIVDGPGSGENDIDRLWVSYPENGYLRRDGIAIGRGYYERLLHVLAVLTDTPEVDELSDQAKQDYAAYQAHFAAHPEEKPIKRINIIGWSRGGAAAIALAHMISEHNQFKGKLPEVNLFLVDPVPGPGWLGNFTKIPQYVTYCTTILAYHEQSVGFAPVIPRDNQTTIMRHFFMPGNHACLVGNDYSKHYADIDIDFRVVSTITKFIVQRFMYMHGTEISPEATLMCINSDTLRFYDKIKRDEDSYRRIGEQQIYTMRRQRYDLENFIKQFSFDASQYIDHNHEKLSMVVAFAKKIADKEIIESKIELTIEEIRQFIFELFEIYGDHDDKILVCLTISEELMLKHRYDLLGDIANRSLSVADLEAFLRRLVPVVISLDEEENHAPALAVDANSSAGSSPGSTSSTALVIGDAPEDILPPLEIVDAAPVPAPTSWTKVAANRQLERGNQLNTRNTESMLLDFISDQFQAEEKRRNSKSKQAALWNATDTYDKKLKVMQDHLKQDPQELKSVNARLFKTLSTFNSTLDDVYSPPLSMDDMLLINHEYQKHRGLFNSLYIRARSETSANVLKHLCNPKLDDIQRGKIAQYYLNSRGKGRLCQILSDKFYPRILVNNRKTVKNF